MLGHRNWFGRTFNESRRKSFRTDFVANTTLVAEKTHSAFEDMLQHINFRLLRRFSFWMESFSIYFCTRRITLYLQFTVYTLINFSSFQFRFQNTSQRRKVIWRFLFLCFNSEMLNDTDLYRFRQSSALQTFIFNTSPHLFPSSFTLSLHERLVSIFGCNKLIVGKQYVITIGCWCFCLVALQSSWLNSILPLKLNNFSCLLCLCVCVNWSIVFKEFSGLDLF